MPIGILPPLPCVLSPIFVIYQRFFIRVDSAQRNFKFATSGLGTYLSEHSYMLTRSHKA